MDDHIGWDFVTGVTGCAAGEDCSTPDNDYKSAGTYSVIWDGTNSNGDVVSSGVYFYNLSIGKEHVTKKMTFLK